MKVVVFGGGGHGRTLIDALRARGDDVIGVVDDARTDGDIAGVPLLVEAPSGIPAVNAVGSADGRARVFERLRSAGHPLPAIVHPDATVDATARVEDGAHVLAQAYVGAATRVGFGSIVNAGAIVNHDCVIGELVHVAPGAVLSGQVQVGDRAVIGPNATVHIAVRIGAGALVAMGAVVKVDVPDGGHVKAGQVWG